MKWLGQFDIVTGKKLEMSIFHSFFFFKLIYLFMAALGLHCCTQAFSSCGEQGLLFVAVRRLLVAVHRLFIVVASLVVEHGL